MTNPAESAASMLHTPPGTVVKATIAVAAALMLYGLAKWGASQGVMAFTKAKNRVSGSAPGSPAASGAAPAAGNGGF